MGVDDGMPTWIADIVVESQPRRRPSSTRVSSTTSSSSPSTEVPKDARSERTQCNARRGPPKQSKQARRETKREMFVRYGKMFSTQKKDRRNVMLHRPILFQK